MSAGMLAANGGREIRKYKGKKKREGKSRVLLSVKKSLSSCKVTVATQKHTALTNLEFAIFGC